MNGATMMNGLEDENEFPNHDEFIARVPGRRPQLTDSELAEMGGSWMDNNRSFAANAGGEEGFIGGDDDDYFDDFPDNGARGPGYRSRSRSPRFNNNEGQKCILVLTRFLSMLSFLFYLKIPLYLIIL